jgi:5'-3' exonuclease
VPDFIALRGDPSDKLPGAKGVGAVGAAGLLRKYSSLEAALAAGRFQAQADALKTLSANSHDGPKGAVAAASQSETDMGESCGAGARMGT